MRWCDVAALLMPAVLLLEYLARRAAFATLLILTAVAMVVMAFWDTETLERLGRDQRRG